MERNKKVPKLEKKEVKLSFFFSYDMILCIKNPRESTRQLLEFKNKVRKIADQHMKINCFYTPPKEKKLEKQNNHHKN